MNPGVAEAVGYADQDDGLLDGKALDQTLDLCVFVWFICGLRGQNDFLETCKNC